MLTTSKALIFTSHDGTDENPKGVEPWTAKGGLSKLYPTLDQGKVFAVSRVGVVNGRLERNTTPEVPANLPV